MILQQTQVLITNGGLMNKPKMSLFCSSWHSVLSRKRRLLPLPVSLT